MGVSSNGGTPKSSILIGFSIINHPFWGYPYFWKQPYMWVFAVKVAAFFIQPLRRSTMASFLGSGTPGGLRFFFEAP